MMQNEKKRNRLVITPPEKHLLLKVENYLTVLHRTVHHERKLTGETGGTRETVQMQEVDCHTVTTNLDNELTSSSDKSEGEYCIYTQVSR